MFKKEDAVIAAAKFKLSNSLDFSHVINTAFKAPVLICQISESTRKELCLLFFSGSTPQRIPAFVTDKECLMIVFKQEYQQQLQEIHHELNQSEMTEEIEYKVILKELSKKDSSKHFQTVSSLMDIIRTRKGLVTVYQLSSEVAVSLRHLRRIVNQHSNLNLKVIITMERLKQAFILIASEMSVERALFLQGFYDFSHFSKTCQKHLHAKPHQLIDSYFFIDNIKRLYLPNNR